MGYQTMQSKKLDQMNFDFKQSMDTLQLDI